MQIIPRTVFPNLRTALSDRRVIVITGMRRVGKTTTLHWLLEQVSSNNKIYLDLERLDQRAVFEQANYDLALGYLRNLGLDLDQPMTVALDEIQYAPNLPGVVKYLYDHYTNIKFLLTGSSSYYLKNLFSESLSGRKVIFELYPLGFGEYLDFRGIAYRRRETVEEMRFDPFEFERLHGYYEDFVRFGGLPDVVLEGRETVKREILSDIFSSYINIDVRTLADFQKLSELRQLLQILALRIGNKLDISKLASIVGLSRQTVGHYLEFLEKTYVIQRLPAWAGPDRQTALGKKLYFCDNGIASLLANPGEGALFENAVFNQLRPYGELAYYARNNQFEIDFILAGNTALEVKLHPVNSELSKLKRAATRASLQSSWLVGSQPSSGFNDFLWAGSIF